MTVYALSFNPLSISVRNRSHFKFRINTVLFSLYWTFRSCRVNFRVVRSPLDGLIPIDLIVRRDYAVQVNIDLLSLSMQRLNFGRSIQIITLIIISSLRRSFYICTGIYAIGGIIFSISLIATRCGITVTILKRLQISIFVTICIVPGLNVGLSGLSYPLPINIVFLLEINSSLDINRVLNQLTIYKAFKAGAWATNFRAWLPAFILIVIVDFSVFQVSVIFKRPLFIVMLENGEFLFFWEFSVLIFICWETIRAYVITIIFTVVWVIEDNLVMHFVCIIFRLLFFEFIVFLHRLSLAD